MKKIKKYLFVVLLILSVLSNAVLYFQLLQVKKTVSSVTKFSYSEHDTVIYCEKSPDVQTVKLEADKNTFTIGDAKLVNTPEALYLINPEGKINLSDYEGFGFVINSDGKLLYSLNTPSKKQETVYITPSGKKYHKDPYCAGKTAFEAPLETATKLLREPCKICA